MPIHALAVKSINAPLEPFTYEPGPLHPEHVEIKVDYCGLCHSDLAMIENGLGLSQYPLVPGHEVSGTIAAVGPEVKNLKVGQKVGLGWYSKSCMTCRQCMSGNHNLCPDVEGTVIHRHGGFADRVRCHWAWATPIHPALDPAIVGPLFCGGITVFNPLMQFNVQPTDRVGVIGIGGLGHLALQFLNKWGCEVTAFSSSDSKRDEAMQLGAHHVVNSRDANQMKAIAGSLNFVISTIAATIDWSAILTTLAPKGRLHFVGVPDKPIEVMIPSLLVKQNQISSSPLGSPVTTATMLDFCALHKIAPVTESFPMSKANEAIARLRSGKARYRIVLKNDLA